MFEFCLLVVSEMLNVGPWCRLPLTVRWLNYDFFEEYSHHISAPMHMPICCGKVISQKIKKVCDEEPNEMQTLEESYMICSICSSFVEKKELITCIKPTCLLVAHLICLAKVFCKDNMILPIEGICPACDTNVLWGDLIRKKIGCYEDLKEISINSNDCI